MPPCPCVFALGAPCVPHVAPRGLRLSRSSQGGSSQGPPVTVPFLSPADYTWSNVVRLALGAGVLVLLGLIMAEAVHSHQCRPRPC